MPNAEKRWDGGRWLGGGSEYEPGHQWNDRLALKGRKEKLFCFNKMKEENPVRI